MSDSYSGSMAKIHFTGRLQHYRHLLARKWWVLGAGLLAGALIELALARFQPVWWVSAGQMIVNVKLSIPQGAVFTEELSNFLGTQAALMQSDLVLNRALGRARMAAGGTNGAREAAEAPSLRVAVSPRTTIFNLQASGSDPALTREFLQAAMEEYVRLKREMRKATSDSAVADLSGEVVAMEAEVRRAEQEMAEFQGTNSLLWLEEQGNALGTYLASLNQRLEGLKSEYDLLQTLTLDQNLQRQEMSGPGAAPSGARADTAPASGLNPGLGSGLGVGLSAPSSEASTNAVVNNNSLAADYLRAKQQLLLLKAERQDLARFLRPKHPKMVAMSEDIERRERLLEIYRQQNAEQLEARKASVALQIQALEKDVNEWNAKIVDISRKSAEYQRLKSNTQRLQTMYQQLLATVHTVDANKELGAESVSIMEPASLAAPDVKRRRNNLIFAGLACLVASLALLLFLDRLDDRVNSFGELQELFNEHVLAQIPREKSARPGPGAGAGPGKGPKLIQPNDQRHPFIEAYRNLRSSLLYMTQTAKRPRTLLLTSSIPNEGKSMTAANLAIIMAHAGARVLLVDADLRKGVLHHRFGLQAATAEKGLCEVLHDDLPWQELTRPTPYEHLTLLPRGGISNNSGELFLKPAMEAFLRQVAEAFDLVILDSAPVMAADDVTTLAPLADAVLFVLRAEHTSARVAHAALDLLYQRNVRVLGLIFNAVRPRTGDYYYYYGYKDYHTAGSER